MPLPNLSLPEPNSYQEPAGPPAVLHSGFTTQRATGAPLEAQTSPSSVTDEGQKRRRAGCCPFQPPFPFGGFRTTSGLPIGLEVSPLSVRYGAACGSCQHRKCRGVVTPTWSQLECVSTTADTPTSHTPSAPCLLSHRHGPQREPLGRL